MRRHPRVVAPRRHFLLVHARQLETAGHDRRHLRLRGVFDQHHGTVGGLAPAAFVNLFQLRQIDAGRLRQQLQRPLDVVRLLAHQNDVETVLVGDEDFAVAIEEDAARRRQRHALDVLALGNVAELRVLRDLEDPETDGQRRERDRQRVLQHREPHVQAAAIVRANDLRHL